jgi:hypothetical protein
MVFLDSARPFADGVPAIEVTKKANHLMLYPGQHQLVGYVQKAK